MSHETTKISSSSQLSMSFNCFVSTLNLRFLWWPVRWALCKLDPTAWGPHAGYLPVGPIMFDKYYFPKNSIEAALLHKVLVTWISAGSSRRARRRSSRTWLQSYPLIAELSCWNQLDPGSSRDKGVSAPFQIAKSFEDPWRDHRFSEFRRSAYEIRAMPYSVSRREASKMDDPLTTTSESARYAISQNIGRDTSFSKLFVASSSTAATTNKALTEHLIVRLYLLG